MSCASDDRWSTEFIREDLTVSDQMVETEFVPANEMVSFVPEDESGEGYLRLIGDIGLTHVEMRVPQALILHIADSIRSSTPTEATP